MWRLPLEGRLLNFLKQPDSFISHLKTEICHVSQNGHLAFVTFNNLLQF
jgi:hypothetical protein